MRADVLWSLSIAIGLAAIRAGGAQTPAERHAITLSTAPDHFARLESATIRYRDLGAGEPVILIHGFAEALEVWSGLGDSLARDHRVIALDLRGFGQSAKFGMPSDFGRHMADDVINLADALGIPRAHIVGYSMGALIAANIAARYPTRTLTASLVAGPSYSDSLTAMRDRDRWVNELRSGRGITAMLMWLLPGTDSATAQGFNREAMAHNDVASLTAALQSMGDLASPLAREPALPIFIAAAGIDPLGPTSHELARRWKNARLLDMPSANHATILAQPELLAVLRATLSSVH
jgi:pimeloyl-ACP methyl ester carboxylesterase